MKVLHIIPGKDDPTCGIAVAALAIAERQRDAGDTVTCVDSTSWTAEIVRAADEVWVHSMWTPPVLLACLYMTFMAPAVRFVRMPHGCLDPVKLAHHWHKKRWVVPLEKFLFRRTQRIVSTVANETAWIKTFVGEQAPVTFLSLNDPMTRPEVRVPSDFRTLLFVGRLHPLKGLEYLLKALPTDRKLIVIGRDEGEEAKLRAIAAERKLDVMFRGVVSAEEKEHAFAQADVLVLPTLSENYGLVVQEALQHGKPVLTTDGAPAWENQPGVVYLKGYVAASFDRRVAMLREALLNWPCAERNT